MRREPPKDWILPEDRDEHFVNAPELIGRNLTVEQGKRGGRCREIHNYLLGTRIMRLTFLTSN